MAKRGVLYVVWGKGNRKVDAALQRSVQSVWRHHPDIGIEVRELPAGANLLDKSKMYELSPFEETLYLDIDTEVLAKLDFGFEQAARFHMACSICEAPYARRYVNSIQGDVVEYNTGVLFFKKSPEMERLFGEWKRLAYAMDSSIPFRTASGMARMEMNDQGSFAKAVHDLGFNPFVLPMNWNLRPQWQRMVFGPVKIWHDYTVVPKDVVAFNEATKPPNLMHFHQISG
jgi:hypothetical protein